MAHTPDFSSDVTSTTRHGYVRFWYTGDVDVAPVGYAWDFGDGVTSGEAAPIVYWRTTGNKTVKLTVVYADDVQTSEEKVDYVEVTEDTREDYLGLLLEQYRHRDTVRNLISPFLDQWSLLDSVSAQLTRIWSIDEGFGVNLDIIGDLLGLPRLDRNDIDYRVALHEMVNLHKSWGQLEVLLKYTNLFLNAEHISVFELIGAVYVDAIVPDPQNYVLFLQRIQRLAASGIQVRLVISDDGDVPVEFEYTDEPPIHPIDNELSELSYEDNGFLAELY